LTALLDGNVESSTGAGLIRNTLSSQSHTHTDTHKKLRSYYCKSKTHEICKNTPFKVSVVVLSYELLKN